MAVVGAIAGVAEVMEFPVWPMVAYWALKGCEELVWVTSPGSNVEVTLLRYQVGVWVGAWI